MHAHPLRDYAHQQPSLTKKKLRRLEITAGAPKYTAGSRGIWSANDAVREAERALAEQAELSYKRMVQDHKPAAGEKSGRERDTGARIDKSLKRGQAARQTQSS